MEAEDFVWLFKKIKAVAPSTGNSHLKHAPNNQFKCKDRSLDSLASTQGKARLVHTHYHTDHNNKWWICVITEDEYVQSIPMQFSTKALPK